MSRIKIYESNPGDLIRQPGRTMSTYASGLCRVDQTYICRTSRVPFHRAYIKQGEPFPDGIDMPVVEPLVIFPEVQERERGDGFSELSVSAYGRTAERASVESVRVITKLGFGNLAYYSTYEITGQITYPYDKALTFDDLGLDNKYKLPFNVVAASLDAEVVSVTQYFTSQQTRVNWDGSVIAITRTVLRVEVAYDYPTGLQTLNNYISYYTPLIEVTSERNFGGVREIDFIVTIPSEEAPGAGGVVAIAGPPPTP